MSRKATQNCIKQIKTVCLLIHNIKDTQNLKSKQNTNKKQTQNKAMNEKSTRKLLH